MISTDIPDKVTATAVGDSIWLPYTGASLSQILRIAQRMGWEYSEEPHGFGTLLTCTMSPLEN